MTAAPPSGPLAGIRVLDFTRFQAGPAASMHMADLGAEVIKVENTRIGDLGRYAPTQNCQASGYFQALNRNKKSVCVDIQRPEGREVILKLAAGCDVAMENFRPGIVESLGLGYEDLRKANPAIIYAHVSGFGRTGPAVARPCFDLVAQAMGGLMSVTGDPGGSALPAGAAICDQATAVYLAIGVLSALVHRLNTGEGQELDVAMVDATLALQTWEVTTYLMSGVVPPRVGPGMSIPGDVWRRFDTADGALVISGVFTMTSSGQTRWDALCGVLGLDDLVGNPDYDSPMTRAGRDQEFMPRLEAAFRTRTTAEWLSALEAADVIAGPVFDYAQATSDPQVLQNGLIQEFDHPAAGRLKAVGTPIRLTRTPAAIRRRAPELGEDTEEVLGAIGYGAEEIAKLVDSGVIRA
jgi:crotonobetainyl-CoA:carnitine CoA-transferase CaiB-like acyl-CoA transferase